MKLFLSGILWLMLPVILAAGTLRAGAGERPVLAEDFAGGGVGELRAVLEAHSRLEVIEGEGVAGGAALRAAYEGFDQGSRRIVVIHPLGASGTEFTLNYDVRFEENFQFTHGGKLHGLAPVNRAAGGQQVEPERWSARVNFARDGGVRTYLYHQRLPGRFGVGKAGEDFRFEPGRFHAVSLHLKLNDPPEGNNGFARIYIDGELHVEHADVQFRATGSPESLISHLHFSTFHGGSASRWAPRDEDGNYTTVYAFFDNFAVYPGKRVRAEPGPCWRE